LLIETHKVIVTLISSFQALLKKTEAVRTGGADTGDRGHPEEAADVEVARIASEAVSDPEDPAAMNAVADVPVDSTNRIGESEV
jgi:hypothetical protein